MRLEVLLDSPHFCYVVSKSTVQHRPRPAWDPKMKRYFAMLLSIVLVGCAATPKQPDLKRLYAVSASDRFQNPVVLVHGVLASRLRTTDQNKEIWPGRLTNFLFNRLRTLALEIDPHTLRPKEGDVEAYALFNGFAGKRYYDRIRAALEEAGGYMLAQPGQPNLTRGRRYYVFLYDWRRDLVETAAKLDHLIEQIRRDHNDLDLKVDIVAHSMGALLTRYYLRYGGEDVLDSDTFIPNDIGAGKTRKVILIAAPNLGSISGLQVFMKGHKFGLATLYPEIIATMPSAYQVLPHPDRDWMITLDGKVWNRNLYSIATWRQYRWSIYDPDVRARIEKRFASAAKAQRYLDVFERYFERNLERAKRFHRALSTPMKESPVRYIVFGGDCKLTPARCLVERSNGRTHVRLYPNQIRNPLPGVDYERLMLEPGDGRVTKPSVLARNALDPSVPVKEPGAFPLAYAVFLCDSHGGLTANITFQDNLLNILLTQETTTDRVNRQELPIRKDKREERPFDPFLPEVG